MLRFLRQSPEDTRAVLLTALYALAAGLSAVSFMLLVNYLFDHTYLVLASRSKVTFVLASLLVITASSLLVGILLRVFSPNAAGSGIPELKAAYWKELGYVPTRPVLIKFIAGVLSLGGGASLGREGPTVFIGGGVATTLAGWLGTPKRQRRSSAAIGASAGLAAAFNSPLAAITFVLEEFLGDLNSRFLGRVVLSSVLGAFVVYACIGRQPAFSLPGVEEVTWLHYLIVPLVAGLAALAGVAFQRATLYWRARLRRQHYVPPWLLPCCGGLSTWLIGILAFLATGRIGVFGLGYHDLSSALNNGLAWWIAGILVLAKLIATIASYSCGGCGGIFSPTLFIGGLTGYFVGGLAGLWIPLTPADHIVLAAVGMSACLGSVVRAPLTSLLIVFEMTHQFALVPGLMLGTITSQAIARLAGRQNFYDALLLQDGHELIRIRPPRDIQSWQNLPVSAIANPRPIVVNNWQADHLRKLLEGYPYRCFPVVTDGKLQGLVTRDQAQSALTQGKAPRTQDAVTCHPDQPIREIADKFIQSPVGVIVVLDSDTDNLTGLITLHDLLRAQASMLE